MLLDIIRIVAIVLLVLSTYFSFPDFVAQTAILVLCGLSGYLVSRSLHRTTETSLGSFYRRRFLRLYPGLVIIIAFSLLYGLIFVLGDDYSELSLLSLLTLPGLEKIRTLQALFVLDPDINIDFYPYDHLGPLAAGIHFSLLWPLVHRSGHRKIVAFVLVVSSLAIFIFFPEQRSLLSGLLWPFALGAFVSEGKDLSFREGPLLLRKAARTSYPFFLWHWPLFAAFTYVFQEHLSTRDRFFLMAAAALLGHLTEKNRPAFFL